MKSMALVPKHWYSWDFAVIAEDTTIADLRLSSWREKGTLVLEGVEHHARREGFASGDFILERGGSVLVRATKLSAFSNTITFRYNDRTYTLRKKSAWRRGFVLVEGEREIGFTPDIHVRNEPRV